MADQDPIEQEKQRRLGQVDQYAAGATDATDQLNRELSAIVARYGQHGRDSYMRSLERVGQDQAAGETATLAAQNARTIGGLDPAAAASMRGEVGSGYQRAQDDLAVYGALRNQYLGDYGDLVSNYMGLVRETIPLAQAQSRARIEEEAARAAAEAQQNLSYNDMRIQATAAGRLERDRQIQELEEQLALLSGATTLPGVDGREIDATRIALEKQLAALEAKPEAAWATEAAMAMFGDIGAGLFETPQLDAENYRAMARAALIEQEYEASRKRNAAEAFVRSAYRDLVSQRDQAAQTAAQNAAQAYVTGIPVGATTVPELPDQDEFIAQYLAEAGYTEPALPTIDELAVEYAVQSGLSRPEAERLIYGERIREDYNAADAIRETDEYKEALQAAETLRLVGGTPDELRGLLSIYGYPREVADLIVRDYSGLMNTDSLARWRDEEAIKALLGIKGGG